MSNGDNGLSKKQLLTVSASGPRISDRLDVDGLSRLGMFPKYTEGERVMSRISKLLRTSATLAASAIIGTTILSVQSKAEIIDLGFAFDESGSISGTNFANARTALANALATIPVGGSNGNTYRVSVVKFDNTAETVGAAPNGVFTLNTVADRNALVAAVNAMVQGGGNTCISCAALQLNANFTAAGFGDKSVMNITTDGVPVGDPYGAVSAGGANNDAGDLKNILDNNWDGVSAEAIGAGATGDLSWLSALVFPGSPLITNTAAGVDPFTRGFIITLANFGQYDDAILTKVQATVNVPLGPGGLPMLALGAVLFGYVSRRRRKQMHAA